MTNHLTKKFTNEMLNKIHVDRDYKSALTYDYGANHPLDGAIELARILLYSTDPNNILKHRSLHQSRFDKWYDNLGEKEKLIVSTWLTAANGEALWHPFVKFNAEPKTQDIFELFLEQKPHPPYLTLLCLNLIKQIFGHTNDDMAIITRDPMLLLEWHGKLFSDKERIINWLEGSKKPLRYYSGSTNTILNRYDMHLKNVSINRDAEAYYDLGGGYNTSEINRIFGKDFTSLDLVHPLISKYDEDLIIRKRVSSILNVCLNKLEMDQYIERQKAVKYMQFNTAVQSIPNHFNSYVIASTGFMTSTVKMNKKTEDNWCAELIEKNNRYTVTSIVAMHRVIELVAAGKHVQLVTLNRASSRLYSHRVVSIEWHDGKIIKHTILPNVYSVDGILQRISSIVG